MRTARIVVSGLAAALVLSPMAALTQGQSQNSKRELRSRYDMQTALVECLESLRAPECNLGIQLTVRLMFNAHGAFEGRPRFTYVASHAPSEVIREGHCGDARTLHATEFFSRLRVGHCWNPSSPSLD